MEKARSMVNDFKARDLNWEIVMWMILEKNESNLIVVRE